MDRVGLANYLVSGGQPLIEEKSQSFSEFPSL
jgi:hypothetical protein